MKRIIVSLCLISMAFCAVAQSKIKQEHKDRAAEIVKQMTLDEKIDYIGGHESWYIREIPRLGLPAVRMADGPQGVRNNTKSTLYPSGIAAAATWDRALINQMGTSLGKDARARGIHILLGPGANIYRSPLCGRNFEYFGEDPYLAGEIAANYIKGVQSQNVLACIKHFAGNNQEWGRHTVSSDVDVRTLHEIYFPAFEKAVKEGDVATIMTSYNLLNSVHASESKYLNYDVLRDMWGFDGIIMSDWTSVYSPLNTGYYGVDLEMPFAKSMTPEVMKQLVEQGVLDVRAIDRKCQHIIQTILAYEFDKTEQLDKSLPENNPYCDSIAHELSRAAIVMLKNQDNFLPMKKGDFVVCGPNADKIVTGGGSGFVTPLISSSVALGMSEVDKKVKSLYLKPEDKDYEKKMKNADCVVVCLGHNSETEKENADRTFELPEGQVEYLKDVLKLNKNVVVVLNAGGNVEMASWIGDVKAVLMAWYPGQQGGLAISEIITGKINPSGKLPISMEKKIEDNPVADSYYENVKRIRKINPYSRVEYKEGIFMGYRGYEKNNTQPLFPFGYGLSYTTFEYSDIAVAEDGDEFIVSFNVKNTGKVAGAEVAQVYVGDQECYLVRPAKELKGFEKVYLKPGEQKAVSVRLDQEAFRFFDPMEHKWIVEPGVFNVYVGSSSADIRLNTQLTVK